jgi:chaperonin GroEL
MKEKKARVEDAMHATKAAVEEGIVPGGGVAFLRCIEAVKALKGETNDIDVGIKIVCHALEEPTRQIVANAGEEGSVIVKELQGAKGNTGYNAAPAKVAKTALLNAASIAGLMLTTEALVSEIKEKEGGNGGGGMGGMGDGMGGMY